MKRLLAGAMVAALTAGGAWAQDSVRMQMKWVTQAQFAGYYVAEAKGFYDEENLDVSLLPGGPDIAPEQVIAGGGADVITTWMPAALAARERGVPLVNIAQPFKNQGLSFVCRKDLGVETVEDFPGKTLGVWFFGNEYPFYAWMASLGLATDGSEGGVTVLKQAFDVEALLNGSAACISVMTYNEYGQVLDAGLTPDQLTFFSYADQGVRVMEDGLYVLESSLEDPAFKDKMTRFVRASMRGWRYAEENPEEAAQIIVDADQTGLQTLEHQTYMMTEIAKLTAGTDGKLDEGDFQATVDALLAAVSPDNPAITKAPEGMAWTHEIIDGAMN